MKRLLAAAGALSLLAAAGPALAAPEAHVPCKAPKGATVLKAGAKPVESVVTTPVGAAGGFEEEVGTFYLDLGGKPASTKGTVTFSIAWTNPASDYDMVINGANELSTDNPEVASIKATHCRAIKVAVDVFTGLPVDEITFTAKGA